MRLRLDLDRKNMQIAELEKINEFLRQKIGRIKEVFDIKSPN